MASSDEAKLPPDTATDAFVEMNKKFSKTTNRQQDNDRILSDSDSDSSDSGYFCSVCNKKFSGYLPYVQHEKGSKHAKAVLRKKKEKELLKKISSNETFSENDYEKAFSVNKPYAVCKTCNKRFSGPESYEMHLDSKAHKQNILQASILNQVRDNGEINEHMLKELYKSKQQPSNDVTEDLVKDTKEKIASLKVKDGEVSDEAEALECKDCKKAFSGLIPYTQHMMSKVHAKTVGKKTLLEKVTHKDAQYSGSGDKDIGSLAVEDGIFVCKLCTMAFSGPESAMMHLKSRGHSKTLEKFAKRQQKKKKAKAYTRRKTVSSSDSSDSDDPPSGKHEINENEQKMEKESSSFTNLKLDSPSNICGGNSQKNSRQAKCLSSDNSHNVNPKGMMKEYKDKQEEKKQKSVSVAKHEKDLSSGRDIDNPPKDSTTANPTSSSSDTSDSDSSTSSESSDASTEKHKSKVILGETNKVELGELSSRPDPKNSDLKKDGESAVNDETLLLYEKYKNYKKLMDSLTQSEKDTNQD